MHELYPIVQAALYAVMAFSILAAIGVVLLPNIFHAALCLVGTLLGIAGIYLALQAEFIAVVQILIYVGGVMTLVIFAIMMTERMADVTVSQAHQLSLAAFGAGILFLTIIIKIMSKSSWIINAKSNNAHLSPAVLGNLMLGPYVFPFEIISVVLIVALIGAMIIAKKEKES